MKPCRRRSTSGSPRFWARHKKAAAHGRREGVLLIAAAGFTGPQAVVFRHGNCGAPGKSVPQATAIRACVIHPAPVRIPHHIGAGGEKGVCGVATGQGQLVNVLTGQAAPLEIFTGAAVKACLVNVPLGALYFGGASDGIVRPDHDILEQRPVHSHILTVCPMGRNVPGPKGRTAGAVKIVCNGHRGGGPGRFMAASPADRRRNVCRFPVF